MKKPLTPEQLEAIRKKHNHGNSDYEDHTTVRIVQKAKPQPPEGWKEQG